MKHCDSNRFRSVAVAVAVAASLPTAALAQSRRGARASRVAAATPQSPSPVTLTVIAGEATLHWSFDLQNTSGAPIDVVADRRLLHIDVAPSSAPAPTPVRGRRARAPRAATCAMAVRPATNEEAQRVHLAPGEHYTEGFDLRDLCGLRLPSAIVPGATINVHYGFGNARGFAHAITFDNQDPPVVDIAAAAPVVVLGDTSAWPPPAGDARRGDDRLRVTVAGQPDGATLADLRASVRVALAGHYPTWIFNRPGQVRFEVTNPRGEAISCRRGVRDYNPVRDFFTRLGGGNSINDTLVLANLCPPEGFTVPGIYRAQAVFESHASGERFGLQSFVGSAGSAYFFMRVRRGAQPGPYQRLPVDDPFAARSSPRDEGSRRP